MGNNKLNFLLLVSAVAAHRHSHTERSRLKYALFKIDFAFFFTIAESIATIVLSDRIERSILEKNLDSERLLKRL